MRFMTRSTSPEKPPTAPHTQKTPQPAPEGQASTAGATSCRGSDMIPDPEHSRQRAGSTAPLEQSTVTGDHVGVEQARQRR